MSSRVTSSRAASLLLLGISALTGAAEPTLTHMYPVAGTRGTTTAVTVSGKFEPWPSQVWVDAPGITFKAGKVKGKFDVEIAQDAAVGPHLVRLFNEQGASAPRFFIVSSEPELAEVEPNDLASAPQKIAGLPATISGRLDKAGDVDSFAVTLKQGQTLRAAVEAYVLGSTFDGLLRVVDAKGTQLGFNHDGQTLDPLLQWNAPSDGTFIVQLMGFVYPATAGVGLTGGDGCVYRLHLSTDAAPQENKEEGAVAEAEPNDAAANAQQITVPSTIAGGIQKAGDEDRYTFTATKQKAYEIKVIAAQTGSPLDAWLKIENATGKEVARNDDAAGSRDPQLVWTVPSDGAFTVALGDVTHHGSAEFKYRLTISEAKPGVAGTSAAHSVAITAGKEAEIKVAVKRSNGFKTKLKLAAKGLPAGVAAPEVDVPDKDGEVSLKITAEASATAASQTWQLVLREAESGTEYPVIHSMTTTGENNGVPAGYTDLVIDSTSQIWITVIATAAPPVAQKPPAEPAKPELKPAAAAALFVAQALTKEGEFTGGIEGPACDAEGNIYAVSFGDARGIGKVSPAGKAELFVTLPEGSTGNGIRFGRDGTMYVADYTGHKILRIDMKTRAVSVHAHEPKMSQPNDLAITADGTIYASDPNWKEKTGQLWRINRDGSTHLVASGLGTVNGIEVSPDGRALYVNESDQRGVWSFPIAADGTLGTRKLVKQFDDFGFDGMRCDVDGNLYVTRHGKGTVIKLSPAGEVLREIEVLGAKPSNICFGGPDGCTAYVTEVEHTRLVQFRVDRPGLEWRRP